MFYAGQQSYTHKQHAKCFPNTNLKTILLIFLNLILDKLLAAVKSEFYFTTGQRSSKKLVHNGYQFVKFIENSRGIKW